MIRIPEHLLVFTKSTFISQPNHLAGEKKKKRRKKGIISSPGLITF